MRCGAARDVVDRVLASFRWSTARTPGSARCPATTFRWRRSAPSRSPPSPTRSPPRLAAGQRCRPGDDPLPGQRHAQGGRRRPSRADPGPRRPAEPRVYPGADGGLFGQGDLLEMADIGKVLIGRGWAEYQGETLRGDQALVRAGLEPTVLGPKEALGLISANGVTMARGSLVLVDAADLIESMQIAAALSFEAFAANLSVIHPAAARARPRQRAGDGDVAPARSARGRGVVAPGAAATSSTCCRSGACPRRTARSMTR